MLMRSMPSEYVAQPFERNHYVFVDFKGIGVFGDGGGAAAVEPEGFARFGRNGDKAFAFALACQLANALGGGRYGGFVVRDNIGQQHHFRPPASGGLVA